MIFQDPGSSLNPRRTIESQILDESTKCIIVLEGEVVEIEEERHVVVAGEALTFDSRLPHRFCDESLSRLSSCLR
jgi:ABC-type dipeptide/oligopeptide/nickel transport system ATPase subunit